MTTLGERERLLTPSKVTAWLDCAHFLTLQHQVDDGTRTKPTGGMSEFAQLLMDKGLDLIDSSGVAALVKLYKGVRSVGGTFTVAGARDQPLAIFKLLRMDKVFNLV